MFSYNLCYRVNKEKYSFIEGQLLECALVFIIFKLTFNKLFVLETF